ncbi:hypothetical protein ACFQ4C_01610 [Larkinella insperata]|uniref:Uncharacterized protein n=1 Tax=Larkinella insperata TaxID=332158 RepID=A0ABW3Q419_9BACT|nr:hypothetical protein [Larkinella insperata]
MIFTFTILQPEGSVRTFSILSESVVECLDEITPILQFGRSLLFASFKKDNGVLKILPVKVAEGESLTDYIYRLHEEWVFCVEQQV